MILFLEDWDRHPTAVVHFETKNRSFLELAEKYKLMGIKNYFFHLALLNPMLRHVDPHDPDLTEEEMEMIGLECRYNPWYFFREVVRIPPQGGDNSKPLRANRGNIALFWSFFNHVDPALIQPRQTGKSISTDCLVLYLMLSGARNSRINMLTKDNELRVANVDRIKNMRQYLPYYMRMINKKDSDNTHEVTCETFNNRYATGVAQNSESAALNMGRGLTAPLAHIDEGPFINFIDISLSAMLTAGASARREAEDANRPYGSIFTTTAGKKDSRSGKYMYDMIHGGMPWTETLFDKQNNKDLREAVRLGSKGRKPLVNITLSHRQLGYTDEWLYNTMAEVNAFGEDADRDFFNRWTSGGLSSPLATELNERIRASQREPMHIEYSKDNYTIRWYIPAYDIGRRMESQKVLLSMDTSEAVGRDSISMLFICPHTLEVLAASNVNETNLIRFTAWVADLMVKYPNLILIPERKSSGQTLIDTLLLRLPSVGINPFRRIYNLFVDDHHNMAEDYLYIQNDGRAQNAQYLEKNKRFFGFNTSGSGRHSRSLLYGEILQQAARLGCDKCYDQNLIDEVTGLVTKNGRIDHSSSGHDDMVIAWLLAVWFLTTSRNLQFYGIHNALNNVKEFRPGIHIVQESGLTAYEQEQQAFIKEEMETLLAQLRDCQDDIVSMKIELRLKTLDSRLVQTYDETNTIDALIADARSNRARSMRERARRRTDYSFSNGWRR